MERDRFVYCRKRHCVITFYFSSFSLGARQEVEAFRARAGPDSVEMLLSGGEGPSAPHLPFHCVKCHPSCRCPPFSDAGPTPDAPKHPTWALQGGPLSCLGAHRPPTFQNDHVLSCFFKAGIPLLSPSPFSQENLISFESHLCCQHRSAYTVRPFQGLGFGRSRPSLYYEERGGLAPIIPPSPPRPGSLRAWSGHRAGQRLLSIPNLSKPQT